MFKTENGYLGHYKEIRECALIPAEHMASRICGRDVLYQRKLLQKR